MKWVVLVIAVGLCHVEGKKGGRQRSSYEDAIRYLTTNKRFKPLVDAHEANWRKGSEKSRYHPDQTLARFTCTGTASPTVPTSVHSLRPADIKVVAALGDSITAGSCADSSSILTCTTQYRGTSWSIGGDRNVNDDGITVANVLKVFNPDVYGFSTGTGDIDSPGARLNCARSGDESRHMLWQAQTLVQRMKDDPNVDFELDWKVISIFIGGNDLCRFCGNESDYTSELYGSRVEAAIQYLHAEVPRAFVQVASIFDIGPLSEMEGLVCSTVHNSACSCVLSEANRVMITLLTAGFQDQLASITSNANYLSREDFTVVYQPFFENTEPPRDGDGKLDTSFFAADCFHFSRKGHHTAGLNLWNSMFQPVGNKDTSWEINGALTCPGPEEVIRTHQNS